MGEIDDWDKTKENIRPLKQGRAITATTFADIVDPKSSAELNAKRAQLDRDIQNYQGDDPLANWVTLINWVEASYPKGGSQGGLRELVKNCCMTFWRDGKDTKRYFNDERYVQIWIKMASDQDTLKTFDWMHAHSIGSQCPNFYISWAEELEGMKNTVEAERILDLGLTSCSDNANDLLKLQTAKKTILDRDARSLMESGIFQAGIEVEEERNMLGGLRPVGKEKKQAPVNRVGSNKLSSKPIIRPQELGSEKIKAAVLILDTENEPTTRKEVKTPESFTEFPFLLSEPDRENLVVESLKMSKKSRPSLSVSRSEHSFASLGFQILPDPEPAVVPEVKQQQRDRLALDRRGLSSRLRSVAIDEEASKEPSHWAVETDWSGVEYHDPSPLCPIPISQQLEPEPMGELAPGPLSSQIFQWAHRTYPSGCHEVSFEEGLARRWRKKCAAEAAALLKQQEASIEDLQRQAASKLAAAESDRSSAETLRQEVERERIVLAESKKHVEEERLDVERARKKAEEIQSAAERNVRICQTLLEDIASSLTSLTRDVACSQVEMTDAVRNFGQNIRKKLESSEESREESVSLLIEITGQLLVALEERRLVVPSACTSAGGLKNENVDVRENAAVPLALDNILLSQSNVGCSWQSSQPINNLTGGSHVTDPYINALWNQTTMNMTGREMASKDFTQSDLSTSEGSSEDEQGGKVEKVAPERQPVRQTLAFHKSAKVLQHTSSAADSENFRSPSISTELADTSGGDRGHSPSMKPHQAEPSTRAVSSVKIFQDQSAAKDKNQNFSTGPVSPSMAFEVFQDSLSQSEDMFPAPLIPTLVVTKAIFQDGLDSIDNSVVVSAVSSLQCVFRDSPRDLIQLASQPAPANEEASFGSLQSSTSGSDENDEQVGEQAANTVSLKNSKRWREVLSPPSPMEPVVRDSPERQEELQQQLPSCELPKETSNSDTSAVLARVALPAISDDNMNVEEIHPVNFGDENDENDESPIRRKSFAVPDVNDEFNFTRKSMALGDQTFQLGSETQFFSAIDVNKRMASTPKPVIHPAMYYDEQEDDDDQNREEEPHTARRQTRPSYYAYGIGLSPIIERSRESKTCSSSGSSGTATHLRGKKSTMNCSPLKENDEDQPVDPYDSEIMGNFKAQLQDRLAADPALHYIDEAIPKIVSGKTIVKMNGQRYKVEEELGRGNYATVYSIRCRSDSTMAWAMKVQAREGWWDYYIQTETIRRIQALPDSEHFMQHIISVEEFHRMNDGGSYAFLPLFDQGTIVMLINAFQKTAEKTVPELLAMKLGIDILRAVEALHAVNIIHGDIKADNFLLRSLKDLLEVRTAEAFLAMPSVVLTDFGCGIDMDLFPPSVTFTSVRKGKSTAGFEILKAKPWTFQIDLLGILDVMHSLLFGEYMKVYQERAVWRISKSFKRTWSPIWDATFNMLLNVASCQEIPPLAEIRQNFQEEALRLLEGKDIERFTRQLRVNVFMQRKSCFVGH